MQSNQGYGRTLGERELEEKRTGRLMEERTEMVEGWNSRRREIKHKMKDGGVKEQMMRW